MFVSYSYCQRKVYNLLNCKDQNISHEYCEIINKFAAKNIKNYYDILVSSGFNILEKSVFYCNNRRYNESDVFSQIDIRYNNLVAYIDLLKIIKPNSSKLCLQYEPYISIGNNEINPEAKQRMEFIAYILSQKFSCIVPYGIIIRKGGKTSRIKLSKQPKDIEGIIVKINSFNGEAILKPPSIFFLAINQYKKL